MSCSCMVLKWADKLLCCLSRGLSHWSLLSFAAVLVLQRITTLQWGSRKRATWLQGNQVFSRSGQTPENVPHCLNSDLQVRLTSSAKHALIGIVHLERAKIQMTNAGNKLILSSHTHTLISQTSVIA